MRGFRRGCGGSATSGHGDAALYINEERREEANTRYEDLTRICADCGREFTWTAGEQEFFHQKGFTEPPKRCQDCRQAKRTGRGGNEQRGGRARTTAI